MSFLAYCASIAWGSLNHGVSDRIWRVAASGEEFPKPAARANAKAPGGRLVADAITRQLEVAELVLTGIDEVIPA